MMVSGLFQDASIVANLVAGRLEGAVRRPIRDVQVDSRECSRDSLFVALHGDRTDGHFFLEDAFRRGSSLSFVSRRFRAENEVKIAALCKRFNSAVLVVDDTLSALQHLAADHLTNRPSLTTVAITGSNGKTTTKDLVGDMLSRVHPTSISPGNLNSDIGLPLACFAVKPEHRYGVFEMGMNRPGEIGELVSIVRPKVAAITNIGTAHIGILGSREAIACEKAAVYRYVCDGGRGFVAEDEPYKDLLIADQASCIDTFGIASTKSVESVVDLGIQGSKIRYEGVDVIFPLLGSHNIQNALCAISIAQWLEVPSQAIRKALAAARPRFGRGQLIHGRVTLLLDCYNANRQSVVRAIEMLDSVSTTGRKILILGSMMELGEYSIPEHRAVGRAATGSTADVVVFVGEAMKVAYDEQPEKGLVQTEFLPDVETLQENVNTLVDDGDFVLIKGSRSLELERLVAAIDPTMEVEE